MSFRTLHPKLFDKISPAVPVLLLGTVVLLALPVILPADEPRFDHVERLSGEDGLSHSTVWDIHQDRRGFLWFGTGRGLNRYDGYELKVYQHDPEDPESPSASEVMVIHEDRQGSLWFGTRSRGLNRYDPSEERFERYEHDPEDPESLLGNRVRALLEDRSGTLWVGTFSGLSRWHRATGTFTRYQHDPADPDSLSAGMVWTLLEDKQGVLWIGTRDGGLDRFEPHSERFVHYRHDPADPRSLTDDTINALHEDGGGGLWVGTRSGLNRFDRDRDSFVRYEHDPADPRTISGAPVLAILEDGAGELWIGTDGGGLDRLDSGRSLRSASAAGRDAETFIHHRHDPNDAHSLSSDQILDIHEDRSGILWLATRAGINKFDRRREQFTALRPRTGREGGLSSSQVWSVTEDHTGAIWVGTLGGGLTALDRAQGTAVTYRAEPGRPDSLSHDAVTSVLPDKNEELWIGTRGGGLNRLDRSRRRFTHYRHDPGDASSLAGDYVRCLIEDRSGDLWIGIYNAGIQRFDRERQAFGSYLPDASDPRSLSSANVYNLYEDRSGDLWVATYGGLNHLARDDSARPEGFTRYLHEPGNPNSLSSNDVTSIVEDATGILWIGTSGGGLNRLDRRQGEFRSYWQKDGLADDKVVGLIVDDRGDLWISTGNGLSRFDPRSETFRNYDIDDGLHDNVFYIGPAYRSSHGEIFFGGPAGLTSFFPDRIADDPHPPPVMLTDFLILNEPVPLSRREASSPLTRSITATTELVLTHRHKVVGFEFAGLHYASPRQNRYAYRLEGFDDGWIETDAGKRFAQYTNLDPGKYVFRVKASNKDGVWNEDGASAQITVLPPPWKTWWAYSLYVLALAAVVLGYVRSHKKELRRERETAEREREISRRLREVDKLKDEFLANTSHELRTPLYGMTGLAESLIDGAAGELPSAAKSNLSMIVQSGRRLSHLINDILDFSKLKHHNLELDLKPVDLHALVDVVLILLRPLVNPKDLELRNSVRSDLPSVEADENRLQQILHNLVGNAVKFTESGEVEVTAAPRDDQRSPEGGQAKLVVSVRDTGIGISKEQKERIFDAFAQADASVERQFGGTGLGLAVARQLIELHGGTLSVQSAPGSGSTFLFDLPISGGQPAEAGAAEPRIARFTDVSVLHQPPSGGGGASVLVVDDEPVVRQVLTNQLTAQGFDVTPAASGDEALGLLAKRAVDLVLLDVMMPRMSGFEVCRQVRERYAIEELPVIFLTAKNRVEDLVVGLAAGANDYLSKPVSKSELLARVQSHIALLLVNRQLAGLVAERTSQLDEREHLLGERTRLISELEARNAELARFNYTVAHDFKNPLTTIRAFVGQLETHVEKGDRDRLRADLRHIDDAASNLHRLLDQLYEFSRIERSTMPCEEVALGDIVSQATAELEAPLTERGVEVGVAADLPWVCGDRARLLEAVRHLLGNAVKYLGKQPSPRIEIGARSPGTPDGEPTIVYIRDNGVGIDPKYHEKIFGLFERLDPEASEGTGIGLALVKRIVEVHGGGVWVESEGREQGATFCFTLPHFDRRKKDR